MAKFRNANLRTKLDNTQPKPKLVAANAVPKPNAVNRSGHDAYAIDKWLRLVTMLNTLKLESQFYRSENETMRELKTVLTACAKEDPYLTAQAIVYSRCVGEGMRSINHLAASYLAPYVTGQEWSKRFYSLWDKKNQKGGTIFRPDDMAEILAAFSAMNKVKATNAMKKGFADAIERLDAYSILKYKSALIDVINLVHPDPKRSKAFVTYNNEKITAIDAVIRGYAVSADTWEAAQSDAGQEVAKAVKAGKITKSEAAEILTEAKAENWNDLLTEGKLGALAALRNIRNILKVANSTKTLRMLELLLSDGDVIRKAKIMPYQIDLANEVLKAEFQTMEGRQISQALLKGYETAVPNLAEMLPGRNLVIVDQSGSMTARIADPNRKTSYVSSCADKANLIAATIAKATNADIITFGSGAVFKSYNVNSDVFSIAEQIRGNMGMTNLASAWQLAAQSGKKYDRVFILSDNECNRGNSYAAYTTYLRTVGNPYVYSVDMASYGTTQLVGDNVRYYYGYGFSMFDDIANVEFNPAQHMDKIRKIVI